jgi:hypothetical protein
MFAPRLVGSHSARWRESLFIDMPLACLCIFVDALVKLQLDGVGSALFKSIKFQFFASEDDFITLQASLPVRLVVLRLSFETGYVNLPHEQV